MYMLVRCLPDNEISGGYRTGNRAYGVDPANRRMLGQASWSGIFAAAKPAPSQRLRTGDALRGRL